MHVTEGTNATDGTDGPTPQIFMGCGYPQSCYSYKSILHALAGKSIQPSHDCIKVNKS